MKKLLSLYNDIDSIVRKIDDPKMNVISDFLGERIRNPDSYVMFVGETSSGKSTVINGLLGSEVLYCSPAPSTGAITEIVFEKNEHTHWAINRNATMEMIDENTFCSLSKKPDKELQRLRYYTDVPDYAFAGMRLFDTPGYGSLMDEHESILRDFLPNCDVVVYTVNYRIGFQQDDYQFVRYLNELMNENVEFLLVVNRCPKDAMSLEDIRISEILTAVQSLLDRKVPCVAISNCPPDPNCGKPLPAGTSLWKKIEKMVNSKERKQRLYEAMMYLLRDLYNMCEENIRKRRLARNATEEQKKQMRKDLEMLREKTVNTINSIVVPGFEKIEEKIPGLVIDAGDNIFGSALVSINRVSNCKMDEMINYMNVHILPYEVKKNTKEITFAIESDMNIINEKAEDMLNVAIADFEQEITIRFNTELEKAVAGIGRRYAERMLTDELTKYFVKYSISNMDTGIVNIASFAVKRTGSVVGGAMGKNSKKLIEKFSSRIMAGATKILSAGYSVILELLSLAIDYGRWKSKLSTKVRKAIDIWRDETQAMICRDLQDMKKENIETINKVYCAYEEAWSLDDDKKTAEEYWLDEMEEELGILKEKLEDRE